MQMTRGPSATRGVSTLMHVGADVVEDALRRDKVSRMARTAGWIGTGLWAAGKLGGEPGMAQIGFWVAVSGWVTSIATR